MISVAIHSIPFLVSFKRHFGWTNVCWIHQAEYKRTGTRLVSIRTLGKIKVKINRSVNLFDAVVVAPELNYKYYFK